MVIYYYEEKYKYIGDKSHAFRGIKIHEKTTIDKEVIDAVGELTNMICGGVKTRLAKLDMKFDLALPTTIVGKGVQICYPKNTPVIVIPFMTESGEFVVEANLRARK